MLHTGLCCLTVSKCRYFQVAESQVMSVLLLSWSSVIVSGIGLLPGCGIPGHVSAPVVFVLDHRLGKSGYFQVAESQVMARSPFIGSLLPGCGLERDGVPGHGGGSFLAACGRRASRFRERPRSCQSSTERLRQTTAVFNLSNDFACVPRHI